MFGTLLCHLFYNLQSPSFILQWNGRSHLTTDFRASTPLLLSFCASVLATCRAHTARRCNSGARLDMQPHQENRNELEAWDNPLFETPPPIASAPDGFQTQTGLRHLVRAQKLQLQWNVTPLRRRGSNFWEWQALPIPLWSSYNTVDDGLASFTFTNKFGLLYMSPPAISTIFPINRILHSISMRSILIIHMQQKENFCKTQVSALLKRALF